MKSTNIFITRYDADDGKVFDWLDLESHISKDDNGNDIQEHLYAKTLFIGDTDSIYNYVEVSAPTEN